MLSKAAKLKAIATSGLNFLIVYQWDEIGVVGMAREEEKESGEIFSTSAHLKVSSAQEFVAQSSQESAGSKINKI